MKFRIYIEVDVSKTIAETIQRNGFEACPDGSAMQIRAQHSPTIPRRKTKVVFVENPIDTLENAVNSNAAMELLKQALMCDALDDELRNQIKKIVAI